MYPRSTDDHSPLAEWLNLSPSDGTCKGHGGQILIETGVTLVFPGGCVEVSIRAERPTPGHGFLIRRPDNYVDVR